jgi:opacity protein-like surface antigen
MTARVIPYVVGGGGVANVRETFTITPPVPVPSGIPVVVPSRSVTQSSTDLVLTIGGGVGMLVAAHVSIDVDLRYLRLMANRDLNVGRFGVGLSYRF